eukprot:1059659-Rhodomonas_salina.2
MEPALEMTHSGFLAPSRGDEDYGGVAWGPAGGLGKGGRVGIGARIVMSSRSSLWVGGLLFPGASWGIGSRGVSWPLCCRSPTSCRSLGSSCSGSTAQGWSDCGRAGRNHCVPEDTYWGVTQPAPKLCRLLVAQGMDAKTKDMSGKKSIALGVALLEQEQSIVTPPPGSRCMGGVSTAQGVDSKVLLPDDRPDELLVQHCMVHSLRGRECEDTRLGREARAERIKRLHYNGELALTCAEAPLHWQLPVILGQAQA